MPKMSLTKLKAILQASKFDALAGIGSSKLSQQRSDALDYYQGEMAKDMPAIEGRSRAVSMDVSDTIEGIMPSLMEIFCASEDVIRFDPVGPEDVQSAEQETDYINHVFMQKNPGFLILYSFIKDALLSKVGVVKTGWEVTEKEERDTYYDIPDDAYGLLVSDPDIEVVEHSEHPIEAITGISGPSPQGAPMLHDVTVVKRKSVGMAKVWAVPPEEFGISKKARNIADANYVFHEVIRTQSELIDLGYDPEQVKDIPSYVFPNTPSIEMFSRDTVNESSQAFGDEGLNDATRQMKITEHYIKLDYDGDGKAKLYKVTTGGDQAEILRRANTDETGKRGAYRLEIEPQDMMPFAAMTPVIVTHRFFGRSLADLVMDIQRIKTALLRGLLDNAYLSNNPRVEVAESYASDSTLDDLLVSRPGGIVRTKQPGGLNWQVVPNIAANVYPLLEYQDSIREWRTGVSKAGQGLDANALQNQTATAANQLFTAAQARMKLIARIFAETGIRDLFYLLHAQIRKHGSQAETVRLRNQWVTVDPRNWRARNDMTVNVGLGTGGKTERLAHLTTVISMQKDAMINGLTNLVTPVNLYNSAKELVKLVDLKTVEPYFTDPATSPPPQQPPDPKMMEIAAKSQSEQQSLQAKAALEQQTIQADAAHQQMKTQADIALAERKFELERSLKLLDAQIKIQESERQAAEREQVQAQKAAGPVVQVNHTADEIMHPLANVLSTFAQHLATSQHQHAQHMQAMVQQMNAPKRIVRGPDGRPSHVETVTQ